MKRRKQLTVRQQAQRLVVVAQRHGGIVPVVQAGDPVLRQVAEILHIEGYARIDAFVRVRQSGAIEVLIIEVNSLPGMTPATCIFHQTALAGYTPYQFIDRILDFGKARAAKALASS